MKAAEIEKRLTALEAALARLSDSRGATVDAHPVRSLERIHGVFEDDEALREAMRLGRQWRQGKRRSPRKPKAIRR